MYTVRWCDHEGNLRELLFEQRRDANAEARRLSEDYDGVTVEEDKPRKPPKLPAFLHEALETGRTVTVIVTNGYQMDGVIIDIDTDLRTITLNSEYWERLVFMSAISTII